MNEALREAGFYVVKNGEIGNVLATLSLREIAYLTSRVPTSSKGAEWLINPELIRSQGSEPYTAISPKDNKCIDFSSDEDKKVICIYAHNLALGESFKRMITIDNEEGISISTLFANGLSNSVLVYSTADLTYCLEDDYVKEHFSGKTQIYSPNVLQALKSICGDDVICGNDAITGLMFGNVNPIFYNSVNIERKTFQDGRQAFTRAVSLRENDSSAKKHLQFPPTKPLAMIGNKACENSIKRIIMTL